MTAATLAGNVAWVTGAGRGIGRATALALAAAGAQVALCARTAGEVAETVDAIRAASGSALSGTVDVADEAAVESFAAAIAAEYGRLDILVHCAAIIAVRPFAAFDTTTWDEVLNVNLRGAFLCARAAFRAMQAGGGGHIILLSSLSGVRGPEKFPGLAAYKSPRAVCWRSVTSWRSRASPMASASTVSVPARWTPPCCARRGMASRPARRPKRSARSWPGSASRLPRC